MPRASLREIGRELGLDKNTVKLCLVKAGIADQHGRGGFDLDTAIAACKAYADPSQVAAQNAAGRGHAIDAGDAVATAQNTKSLIEELKLEKLQIELEVRRAQLIPREAVEATIIDVVARARTQLLNIGHRCAGKLINMGDEAEIARIVNNEARIALAELSDTSRLVDEALS
jgi:hypothetical protein